MSTPQVQEHPRDFVPAVPPATAAAAPAARATPLRSVLAGPVVAVLALVSAAIATGIAGVPLRDPGSVTVRRMTTAVLILLAFVLVDALVRARGPFPRRVLRALRAKWTGQRIAIVALAVACFHVTYLAYRNIKSVAPLLRPGDVFDSQLLDIERCALRRSRPVRRAARPVGHGRVGARAVGRLHALLRRHPAGARRRRSCSCRDLRAGLFVATALSLAWLLGAGSYLLLPSIGPVPLSTRRRSRACPTRR